MARAQGVATSPQELSAPALRTLTVQLRTMRTQVGALERVVHSPSTPAVVVSSPPLADAKLWCCAREIFEINASMDAIGTELARLRRKFAAPLDVERRAIIAEAEVELARARRALEAVAGAGSADGARTPLRSIGRATESLRTRAVTLDQLLRG